MVFDEDAAGPFARLLKAVAGGLGVGVFVCGGDEGDYEGFDGGEELGVVGSVWVVGCVWAGTGSLHLSQMRGLVLGPSHLLDGMGLMCR